MRKLYYLLPSIIVYVCFAFVGLELNLLEWDGVVRTFFVFVLLLANAFGLWIINEEF